VSDRDPIQISESELLGMTNDLDEMHHESMPQMYEAVSEWAELRRESGIASVRELGAFSASRRGFLAGTGIALGGVILAACDLAIAALATSLENLAVATYQGGIDAATAGKLGAVPPAVVTFAQTAQKQHMDHAAAWNAILTSAGKPKVTGVDTTVKTAVIDPAFATVKDVPGLAMLALQLENVAAATYLESIGLIESAGGIKTSASIQPVEMQHAAILNFVLGKYPVPDSFAKTAGARAPSDMVG